MVSITNTEQAAFAVSSGKANPYNPSPVFQPFPPFRGLLFTCRALQEARAHPHEDKMQPSFTRAYDSVLRHHHGRLVRTVVGVALKACPTRADFFARIAQGGDQTKLDEELGKWLEGLDGILARMTKFYADNAHGNV